MALALPEGGKVIGLDNSGEYTASGKKYWEKSGVDDKIDLMIGCAIDSMKKLLKDGQEESFDMVFIDANKTGYDEYYEMGLRL